MTEAQRAEEVENNEELEAQYKAVAVLGDTEPPENPEDEVDFHYVCFAKSHLSDNLYMMDGDRNGPVHSRAIPDGEDLLSETGIKVVQKFIQKYEQGGHFSLLALAPA